MNKQLLKECVQRVVSLFLEKDTDLLKLKVYEPAVSHRIAVYLEKDPLFANQKLNFDCEYDKRFKSDKPGPNGKPIRPDVLIHKRNSDENNILVIEVKKTRVSKHDVEKLKTLTNQKGVYKYLLGAFIHFPNTEPRYKWFFNGSETQL